MYNINWITLRIISTPWNKRQPDRMTWFDVLISQVKKLHGEFYDWITLTLYYAQFNGQIMNLEHVLNDIFDNALRRIYIDNTADLSARIFIFNKAESQPPFPVFNKWNAVDTFSVDDHIARNKKIYKALSINSNTDPPANPAVWQYVMDQPILFNREDYALYNTSFIVYVPTGLVFDINRMKALVNKFKLAGKSYSILFY